MQSFTKGRTYGFAATVRGSCVRVAAALALLVGTGCSDGVDLAGLVEREPTADVVASSESTQTSALEDKYLLPAWVEILRGNRQTGTAGKTLDDVLRVRVNDGHGHVMPNTRVQWQIQTGGGSVSSTETTTDGRGITEIRWTLGAPVGMQYMKAVAGLAIGRFEATSVSGSSGRPATVTTLAADSARGDRIYVHFREVDDGTGRAANYVVRYQETPIGSNWGGASDVSTGTCRSLKGTSVGAVRSCSVGGLRDGVTYDVQVVAWRTDQFGARVTGRPSNVATMKAGSGSVPTSSGTLSISPSSLTLSGTGTVRQLSVTARTSSGSTIDNPEVTWSSSNTGVATVDGSGRLTTRGVGSAVIKASGSCCSSARMTVTVEEVYSAPAQPSVSGFPNEPSDFSRTVNESFGSRGLSSQTAGRWLWGNGGETTSKMQIVPGADGSAMRWIYDAGRAGGDSPGRAAISSTAYSFRSYYIGLRVRWSQPWTSHGSGANKILYWGSMEAYDNGGWGPTQYYLNRRGNLIDLTLQYGQDEGQTNVPWSDDRRVASTRVDDGRWHTVELRIDGNGAGERTCRARIWVDGILNIDIGNLQCSREGSRFYGINLDPVWGGMGGTKPQTEWIEMDHLLVSGR